jgi:hypothetical protein
MIGCCDLLTEPAIQPLPPVGNRCWCRRQFTRKGNSHEFDVSRTASIPKWQTTGFAALAACSEIRARYKIRACNIRTRPDIFFCRDGRFGRDIRVGLRRFDECR